MPRLNLGPGAKDTYPCGQLTARESSGLYVDQSFGTNSRSASLASSTGYAQNYASRRGTAERESSGLYVDDRNGQHGEQPDGLDDEPDVFGAAI